MHAIDVVELAYYQDSCDSSCNPISDCLKLQLITFPKLFSQYQLSIICFRAIFLVNLTVSLRDPDHIAESLNSFRADAAAAEPAKCQHTRIVPTINGFLIHLCVE